MIKLSLIKSVQADRTLIIEQYMKYKPTLKIQIENQVKL